MPSGLHHDAYALYRSPIGRPPVVLTARVASTTSTPAGSVNIINSGTTIATAALVNGSAQTSLSTLAVGTNPLSATYSDETNFVSTSAPPPR